MSHRRKGNLILNSLFLKCKSDFKKKQYNSSFFHKNENLQVHGYDRNQITGSSFFLFTLIFDLFIFRLRRGWGGGIALLNLEMFLGSKAVGWLGGSFCPDFKTLQVSWLIFLLQNFSCRFLLLRDVAVILLFFGRKQKRAQISSHTCRIRVSVTLLPAKLSDHVACNDAEGALKLDSRK